MRLTILVFFSFLFNVQGPRQSGLDKFLNNQNVKKLLEQYVNDEIKTQESLLDELENSGIFISLRTLKNYMARAGIKKSKRPDGEIEVMEDIDIRQCWSKFDNQLIGQFYMIGPVNLKSSKNWSVNKWTDHSEGIYFNVLLMSRLYGEKVLIVQWISKTTKGNIFTFNKLARTRSTNPIEAWHSAIKRDPASVRHASVANVLNYFQQIFSESDERLVKILAEKIRPRPRDNIYEQIDSKLLNALNEYEEMLDHGEISEEEFAKSTESYLNRISYLLLQMDSAMTLTRKDHRIRERKQKVKMGESVETTTLQQSHGEKIKQWVKSRKMQTAAPQPETTSASIELIEDEKENIPPFQSASASIELVEDEPEVLHIKSLGQNAIKILFNPVDPDFRDYFCDKWEYECSFVDEDDDDQNSVPFEFLSQDYGPGSVKEIDADGNCGFRSLSYALTGTVNNHAMIRRDVIEYIEDTIYQHTRLGRSGNDWWQLFDSIENLRQHIEKAINVAADAGDVDSWMTNVDVAASAKLFRVNIIVCERYDDIYRWQIYSPDIENSLATVVQKPDTPSIFLYFRSNHYEVIQKPAKINL